MPRPCKLRWIAAGPPVKAFKPAGVPGRTLEAIELGLDELEALRLADLEGLYQDAAAGQMGVSRQTYARILTRARSVVARCLLEEKTLLVQSRNEKPVVEGTAASLSCPVHGGRRRRGRTCHCSDADPGCADPCPRRGSR